MRELGSALVGLAIASDSKTTQKETLPRFHAIRFVINKCKFMKHIF